MTQHHPRLQKSLLILAIVLIGINLRPAFSSISPLLTEIRHSLALSGSAAGMLTTLPVACLGIFAPLAPWLARRYGAERLLLPLLLTLTIGLALRGLWNISWLFIGTGIAGISIGLLGILLPSIIKREFPTHPDLMTGVYTMSLCLGTALAAGIAFPLFSALQSLPLALAAWAMPVLIAILFWWPFRHLGQTASTVANSDNSWQQLLCDKLAWHVTMFMGLQSALAYCVFGWLPTILQDRGIDAVQSGLFLSGSVMVQVVSALLIPWITSLMRDQRGMNCLMFIIIFIGFMGAIYGATDAMWWWMITLGLGQGGGFAMALAMIVLRTRTPSQAAQLSAMSQGLGYMLASLGPLIMGMMHESSNSWQDMVWLLAAITLAGLFHGSKSGAKQFVLE